VLCPLFDIDPFFELRQRPVTKTELGTPQIGTRTRLSQNEIGCARISMMAGSTKAPFKGRIQKRKTSLHFRNATLQLVEPFDWPRDNPTLASSAQSFASQLHLRSAVRFRISPKRTRFRP
jgi:hypothetical protein